MLYRFTPNGRAEWNDLPGSHASEVVEHGKSLDDIPGWVDADRVLDGETLRIALRSGYRSQVGIIVDVSDLVDLDWLRRNLESHRQLLAARPAARKQLEMFERIMPGTLAAEERSIREIDESTVESVRERLQDLGQALAKDPQEDLVSHWRRLGGWLPNPL